MHTPTITPCDDAAAVARAGASRIAETAAAAVAARGRFTLVLSGGSTPKVMYRLLASDFKEQVRWQATHIFFGDERCVTPDHPDSNARMARESLLDHVPVPARQVHRVRGEAGPGPGAAEYDQVLRTQLSIDPESRFDITLLGMGSDGHTASLFPGREFSTDHGTLAAPAIAPPASPISDRITLTLEALALSRRILFLITGEDKRRMLRRVLKAARRGGDPGLPASMVTADRIEWIADRAALGL